MANWVQAGRNAPLNMDHCLDFVVDDNSIFFTMAHNINLDIDWSFENDDEANAAYNWLLTQVDVKRMDSAKI